MAEPGVLYVVATPIGNLQDLTLRAISTLREVKVIACEDTRVTRKLLDAHDISTPTVSHHAHSGPQSVSALVERLTAGESVAYVSDAGTPLVSDPGAELVAGAIAAGARVVPIPGASAILAAVMGAGLPPQPLLFLGFLPKTDRDRREILGPLRDAPYTLVLYESPNRLGKTLEALSRSLGDRPAAVARELTKKFEAFTRGALSELAANFAAPPKGEVVIVVGPARPGGAEETAVDVDSEIARLISAGERPAEIARAIAGAHGLTKKEAYARVVALRSERG